MRVKKGTLDHLQTAFQEMGSSIIQSRIGDSYDITKGYLLYGLKRTGSGLVFNVTAGALYFNGEVYLVDAFSFTATTGQTAVGTITTTNYTAAIADPVRFSNNADYNIHEIRKIVFSSGVAGSGAFDFVNLIQYLEEDDYVDISASIAVNANILVTKKMIRRYKDGRVDINFEGQITTNITNGNDIMSGLPIPLNFIDVLIVYKTTTPSIEARFAALGGVGGPCTTYSNLVAGSAIIVCITYNI